MKILVTGGAGFIGHNVVNKLESLGHECYIIDSLDTYGIIPEEELNTLLAEREKYCKAFLAPITLGTDSIDIDFEPEIIIHLAGPPGQQFVNADPQLATNTMIGGTMSLLKKYKVSRFVYVSSSMIYGNFTTDVDEFSSTNPINQYGIFKLTSELLVKNSGLQYNIVRPSAVYGERSIREKVINKFFLAAINDQPLEVKGANERLDFTYVDDVVDGIILAALHPQGYNQTYNITRSASRTLLEAAEVVVKIVGGGDIKVVDRDVNVPKRGTLIIDRAVRELGYSPKTNIEEGFQKCYEWIKNTVH